MNQQGISQIPALVAVFPQNFTYISSLAFNVQQCCRYVSNQVCLQKVCSFHQREKVHSNKHFQPLSNSNQSNMQATLLKLLDLEAKCFYQDKCSSCRVFLPHIAAIYTQHVIKQNVPKVNSLFHPLRQLSQIYIGSELKQNSKGTRRVFKNQIIYVLRELLLHFVRHESYLLI